MRSNCILFVLCLLPIGPVLCEFFCDEPTIDSIAYETRLDSFFITSGGYYWWIKKSEFPPKESDAMKLPEPFKKPTAAVFVDTINGCIKSRSGIQAFETKIIITEWFNDKHHLIVFDTYYLSWGQPIPIDSDHCLSPARIDFTTDRKIDAMFARNNLDIFLVQGNNYAMVNCSFVCTDPLDFGDFKPKYNISDWETEGPIHAMYATKRLRLILFQTKTYFSSRMSNMHDGRFLAFNKGINKNILTDFLKFNKTKCQNGSQTTVRDSIVNRTSTSVIIEDVSDPTMDTKKPPESNTVISPIYTTNSWDESVDNDDEVGTPAIMLLVGLFIFIIIWSVIGLFLLMAVLKNTSKEASHSPLISTVKYNGNNKLYSNLSRSPGGLSSSQVVSPRSQMSKTYHKSPNKKK